MIKAVLDRQLMVIADNETGMLAAVTNAIAQAGINLVATCAYAIADKAAFMLVTDDNNEAKKLLTDNNFDVQEEEIILLSMDNKPGVFKRVTEAIARAEIDLTLMYGSVDPSAEVARIVLHSRNNLDVMMLVKSELERS